MAVQDNAQTRLRFEIPVDFYKTSQDCASRFGMEFSLYTRTSLDLVRQIGKNGVGSAAQIIVDSNCYPVPGLKLPPAEQHQQLANVRLPLEEKVAFRQDCLRTSNTERGRVLRCLNFSNYLVELGALPPTIQQHGTNYVYLAEHFQTLNLELIALQTLASMSEAYEAGKC